jgi:hypothetical protein
MLLTRLALGLPQYAKAGQNKPEQGTTITEQFHALFPTKDEKTGVLRRFQIKGL